MGIVDDERGESTQMTKAEVDAEFDWLLEEGLIEHNGEYRDGQPIYVVTAKGREMMRTDDDGDV